MTILKTALALVFAVASTSASANIVEKQSTSAASEVSTCYYEGSSLVKTATSTTCTHAIAYSDAAR